MRVDEWTSAAMLVFTGQVSTIVMESVQKGRYKMTRDKWLQFKDRWCDDEAGFLGLAAWVPDEGLDSTAMVTGCELELSSQGLRVDHPVLDWQTGEILLKKDEWFTPDKESLSKFKGLIQLGKPEKNWEREYYYDLEHIVRIMKDWLSVTGEVNHQWLVNALVEMVIQAPAIKISFEELVEQLKNEVTFVAMPKTEHDAYMKALEAKTPQWLVENLHQLAEGF